MGKAAKLAAVLTLDGIADEVEIDGEMVDLYALHSEFQEAFEALRTSGYTG